MSVPHDVHPHDGPAPTAAGPAARSIDRVVPAALADAVAAWRTAGRPAQGATEYDKARWAAALPDHTDVLNGLPPRLNRAETRSITEALLERDAIVEAFVVTQVWGYGRRGYGPYRVRRVLEQPDAVAHLRGAHNELVRGGPVAGFLAFADEHRIAGLGPAFFTKFMFFADPTRRSLVLDEYVATWVELHAGRKLLLYPPRASAYREYLRLVEDWGALHLAVDEIEQVIFAAEALTRPRNDWLLEEAR